MKRALLSLALVLAANLAAGAQDLTSLAEEVPAISMTLVKVFSNAPTFAARAQIRLESQTDPEPSVFSGTLLYQQGNMLWRAKIGDIKSPQLSEQAAALLKRLNGEGLAVLTRPDLRTNYLILSGAKACVQTVLPGIHLTGKPTGMGEKTIDGRVCTGEKLRAACSDGTSAELLVWRAKELKNLPVLVEMKGPQSLLSLRLSEVQIRPPPAGRFEVPAGSAYYQSIEDLVQSVLMEKMKRHMGLP